MGQVKSIEYPFYDQVMDTIEELKSAVDENNPKGWQLLIHEICRHRGVYLQNDCDVTDIDKLLYIVARECSGFLSSQEVSIPCLKQGCICKGWGTVCVTQTTKIHVWKMHRDTDSIIQPWYQGPLGKKCPGPSKMCH